MKKGHFLVILIVVALVFIIYIVKTKTEFGQENLGSIDTKITESNLSTKDLTIKPLDVEKDIINLSGNEIDYNELEIKDQLTGDDSGDILESTIGAEISLTGDDSGDILESTIGTEISLTGDDSGDISGSEIEQLSNDEFVNPKKEEQLLPENIDLLGERQLIGQITVTPTGINRYKLKGDLIDGIDSIEVSWIYDGVEGSSYKLKGYESGSLEFIYNVAQTLGNLNVGKNIYVIRGYKGGELVDQKEFEINIDKLYSKNDLCNLDDCFSSTGRFSVEDSDNGQIKFVQKQGDHKIEFNPTTGEVKVDRFFYGESSALNSTSVK